MQYAFADKGLDVMRRSIKIVFEEFHQKIKNMPGNQLNLRDEITQMFESVLVIYIFGEDVTSKTIPMYVVDPDT